MTERTFKIDGKKLAALRKRKFLTQAELAAALKVGAGAVARIEQSESAGMYWSRVPKLAEALGMTPDDVVKAIGVGEANGRLPALDLFIPAELAARVELVARARGRTWLEWLARVVENAEARIAAQQQPMGNPTYHKGDTTIELDQVPSQRRRRKAGPTGGEHSPASASQPRPQGRKPS